MNYVKVACQVKNLSENEIKRIFLKHTKVNKFDDEYQNNFDFQGTINDKAYILHLMKLNNKGKLLVDMDLLENCEVRGILDEFKNYSNLRVFPLTIQ